MGGGVDRATVLHLLQFTSGREITLRLGAAAGPGFYPEARLEAEFVDQPPPRVLVSLERVSLPAGSVERHHQQARGTLPKRVLPYELLELRDELATVTELQVGVDPVLNGLQPQFVEIGDRALREGLVRDLCQRGP